jgi:hypothetical protein
VSSRYRLRLVSPALAACGGGLPIVRPLVSRSCRLWRRAPYRSPSGFPLLPPVAAGRSGRGLPMGSPSGRKPEPLAENAQWRGVEDAPPLRTGPWREPAYLCERKPHGWRWDDGQPAELRMASVGNFARLIKVFLTL